MNKRFILCVEYGTGKVGMIVDTPDLSEAIQEFIKRCRRSIPETKDMGLPSILRAEILPLLYDNEEIKRDA